MHYSGRTSYAEVEHRMMGTGSGPRGRPHRLDSYVAIRTKKGKDKEVSPIFASTIAKLKEVHGSQSDADKASLSTNALIQVLATDRKGRTRGVSSWVAKSRIIGLEMSNTGLARQVDLHDAKMSRLEATVQDMFPFMKRSLGEKGKGKGKEEEAGEDEDVGMDITDKSLTRADSPINDIIPYLAPHNRPMMTLGWSSVFIHDLFDGTWIGRGLRDPNSVEGMIVHGRPLQDIEFKVLLMHVILEKENSPVWMHEQCGVMHIQACLNSFIVWPTYLLKPTPNI